MKKKTARVLKTTALVGGGVVAVGAIVSVVAYAIANKRAEAVAGVSGGVGNVSCLGCEPNLTKPMPATVALVTGLKGLLGIGRTKQTSKLTIVQ